MTLEIAFFEQSAETGNKQIVSLSPGDADAFIKILWILKDFVKSFQIEKSELLGKIDEDTIVRCDLSPIIGPDISLYFRGSTDTMRELKDLGGNTDILILETAHSHEYIFTNGEMTISVNKITNNERIIFPNVKDAVIIGRTFKTDKGGKIKDFTKSSSHVLLNIYQDQIGLIERPSGKQFCLGDYSIFEYQTTKPTQVFRSYSFLTVASDEISLTIIQLNDNKYYLKTIVVLGTNMILNFLERLFIEKE